MIRFLLKGILRDKSRSILPIIVVAIGVTLTVALSAYLTGAFGDMMDQNARFDTGHVKVMSQAYAENKDQIPNDLALLGVSELLDNLNADYPDWTWVERIRFGGLIDFADENDVSKGQGPAGGLAVNLLDDASGEVDRLNIESSLVEGRLPSTQGEAIIGHSFAEKLNVEIGDEVSFFGSTMNGSMTFHTFVISGTIRYGMAAMDKGALIIDISDARLMLDMENGVGEILGFDPMNAYNQDLCAEMSEEFNSKYMLADDEFSPTMLALRDQNDLGELIDYSNSMSAIFVIIFVGAMSVVLWNTGLIGGLRRYQEFGIRLALGESKNQIYISLVLEAVLIGIIGSILGTILGLAISYYMQVVGIDISNMLENSTMLMPSVIRSKVTPSLFYLGFIPGVLAMVFGNMLSGIGIYKRETAKLFNELEV